MGNAFKDKIEQPESFSNDIKTKVEDYGTSIKNKAENFIKDENLEDYAVRAKHLYDEGVKGASHLYTDSVAKLQETVKARPIVSLAVAFAAGFATVALTRILMRGAQADSHGIFSKNPLKT